jgi:hypothetical protein
LMTAIISFMTDSLVPCTLSVGTARAGGRTRDSVGRVPKITPKWVKAAWLCGDVLYFWAV